MGTSNVNETSELYLPDGLPDGQRIDIIRHHLDSARNQIRKLQSRVDELDNKCRKNELIIDELKLHAAEANPIIQNIQFWQRVGGIIVGLLMFGLTIYQVLPKG